MYSWEMLHWSYFLRLQNVVRFCYAQLIKSKREENLLVPCIMKHSKVHERIMYIRHIYNVPLLKLLFQLIQLDFNSEHPNTE